MYNAALFDLDGTLIDTEPRSFEAWSRLFRNHRVPHDEATIKGFAGRPGREALLDHLDLFPGHTVDELFAEALGYTSLPDMPPVKAVPGALELLGRLRESGVPLGLVTSGTRDYARHELGAIGALDLFDVLVTSDDVTRGKPDPQGCLACCAALGVEPSAVVVFEDAPAGVAAAKRAGADCVAITSTQPPAALAAADLIVPDLTGMTWPPPTPSVVAATRSEV
ncbi:HAD family hydrolase [Streptomyces cyanogenus]|uniref:Phosphorylated carbohydrates phosphatase n=1 Tax=Streptomyces cyanogenus TaxID=80860 RepID=A0ABX7U2J9_STRCY|nr:HAD family phosphatase [Streptomyces cyanogenus]QTE03047.1 Phosphorylated carbohydrates phosphatase [Streptomyces cyanogenus]